jgi:hypothetical protein
MYVGRARFSGGVGEDLESILSFYEATMVIAGINSQIDKITGIVNMVDKGAARYFFKHIAGMVPTYE